MSLARHGQLPNPFSTEALSARILDRHRDDVRVQKTPVATANLARIIGATLRLSNRQGFHAMSLRQLAKASGLSMGGLYTYFVNKPMLLSMILREVEATATQILTEPPAEVTSDAGTHLAWVIETHIRLTEAMHPWFVFAFMEAKSFPTAERKLAVNMEETTERIIAAVLKQGVASGAFIIPDVALTASLIKPLLQDWYVKRAKYRRRGTSIEAYIAAVTSLIGAALLAKPETAAVARCKAQDGIGKMGVRQ